MDKTTEHARLAHGRTRKILVLHRQGETLARTTDLLERAGFLALCQMSSAGAADFAVRERVDAAVIDFDSLARSERVARALRRHVSLATLPIVLMSNEATAAGTATLAKSLMPLVLVPLLRSLIEHRVRSDAWERRC